MLPLVTSWRQGIVLAGALSIDCARETVFVAMRMEDLRRFIEAPNRQQSTTAESGPLHLKSDSDDLIQAFDDKRKFLRGGATKLRANALNGQGSNLADFDPGTFSELRRF